MHGDLPVAADQQHGPGNLPFLHRPFNGAVQHLPCLIPFGLRPTDGRRFCGNLHLRTVGPNDIGIQGCRDRQPHQIRHHSPSARTCGGPIPRRHRRDHRIERQDLEQGHPRGLQTKEERVPGHIQHPRQTEPQGLPLLVRSRFRAGPSRSHEPREAQHDRGPGRAENPTGRRPRRLRQSGIPFGGDPRPGRHASDGEATKIENTENQEGDNARGHGGEGLLWATSKRRRRNFGNRGHSTTMR